VEYITVSIVEIAATKKTNKLGPPIINISKIKSLEKKARHKGDSAKSQVSHSKYRSGKW
jgi:hypothetical protein